MTESPAIPKAEHRRIILAILSASSGNLVEWYDFYVYSFTALYFAPSFFPAGDRTTQLLNTAGVFAAGFFMRPLGALLFGRIADRRGRRRAMLISVTMMCAGSLMVAATPTYAVIGKAAPLLLLFARLVQGLSVGGEYGTVATYMSEAGAKGRRGFYASFQMVTMGGGQVLALGVLLTVQRWLSEAEVKAWGWRIPFAVGAVAGAVALVMRRSLRETSTTEAMTSRSAGSMRALLKHPRAMLLVLGFTAGGTLFYYTFSTYMQKYLVNTSGMNAKTASLVMTPALIVWIAVQPVFGTISDRIGPKRAMTCFALFAVIGAAPILRALASTTNPITAFGLVAMALAISGFYYSISGLIKSELFPTEIRALGVGVPFSIAVALFGGTAEYVALRFKAAGAEAGFAWYVSAVLAVTLAVALWMPDTRTRGYLDGTGQIG